MGKNQWFSDDDDLDWSEVEKVTRNFKGSAEDIEDILIDELRPVKKKKKKPEKFHDGEA